MNSIQFWIGGAALAFLLLFATACDCDDPTDPRCSNYCQDETDPLCPNYDPCLGQTPVSAEFQLVEVAYRRDINSYIRDTMYYDTAWADNILSQALHQHSNWKYTWKIGAGEYDGPERSLDYSSAPILTPITVTLIVEGPPNTDCFPDDDGRDTVSRVFYRDNFHNNVKLFGYFNEDPADTSTIHFHNPNFDARVDVSKWECYIRPDGIAHTRKRSVFRRHAFYCDWYYGEVIYDPENTGDFRQVRIKCIDWPWEAMAAQEPIDSSAMYYFDGRVLESFSR